MFPYDNAERLAFVWNEFSTAGLSRIPLSPIELLELRKETEVFEAVAGVWATTGTLFTDDEPTHLSTGLVTPNFFSTLGIEPAIGRNFLPSETGIGPGQGVLLSDELWRQHFGADPNILNTTIRIDAQETPVLGVMPRGFKLMLAADAGIPERLDVYSPIPWPLAAMPADQHFLRVVTRLKPGITSTRGDEVVKAAAQRLRERYAEIAASGDEFTLVNLHDDVVRDLRPVLVALMTGVALFLLLAAANVASLTLARASGRHHELAVRACLGASTRRITRLLLAESIVLAAIGTVSGLLVGSWSAKILWRLRPEGLARIDSIIVDANVLVFTAVVAVLATVAFALAPIWKLARRDLSASIRTRTGESMRTARTTRLITAAEVALALVLLVGAGLMARTFSQIQRADVGFNPERLLSFTVALSVENFPTDDERGSIAQQIENQLPLVTGVVEAGGTSHVPFGTWANWSQSAPPEGTPDDEQDLFHFDHRAITPKYLPSIGARLMAGRWFEEHDDQTRQPVVVIDRAVAEFAFPGTDPIGRRMHSTRYENATFVPTWAIVVGVIENIRDRTPATPSAGQVFWPFAQSPRWELTYVMRTDVEPNAVIDEVKSRLDAIRHELAPSNFRIMDSYLAEATANTRFTAMLATIFSGLALLLASLGLYGVITYSTSQRKNDIGIRMALGAPSHRIFRSVVGESVLVSGVGIVVGVIVAIGVTRFMSSLLFNVSATDPLTFLSVVSIFLAVAVIASYLPARRAARVDPIESLRPE